VVSIQVIGGLQRLAIGLVGEYVEKPIWKTSIVRDSMSRPFWSTSRKKRARCPLFSVLAGYWNNYM
jgi:hypothetical protein